MLCYLDVLPEQRKDIDMKLNVQKITQTIDSVEPDLQRVSQVAALFSTVILDDDLDAFKTYVNKALMHLAAFKSCMHEEATTGNDKETEPKTETAPLAKAVTVQKQPAKKKPGRPKKFDEGKVIALFKAGWSVVDIAADMNTEPERIEAIVINSHQQGGCSMNVAVVISHMLTLGMLIMCLALLEAYYEMSDDFVLLRQQFLELKEEVRRLKDESI